MIKERCEIHSVRKLKFSDNLAIRSYLLFDKSFKSFFSIVSQLFIFKKVSLVKPISFDFGYSSSTWRPVVSYLFYCCTVFLELKQTLSYCIEVFTKRVMQNHCLPQPKTFSIIKIAQQKLEKVIT